MIPSPASLPSASTNSNTNNNNNNPLHLPEVQTAMLSHLQNTSSQWANSDLLDTISNKHPNLLRGMNNPRYMAALQSLQSNPKETLEKLKSEGNDNDDIVDWLREFCGVIGEHFVNLGAKEEEKKKKENSTSGSNTAKEVSKDTKNEAVVREMGPLEKKAMKKHLEEKKQRKTKKQTQHQQGQQGPNTTTTSSQNNPNEKEMDNQVASILANDELRSILLDPQMQQIMEECTAISGGTTSSKIRYYMSHETYGPKLRKLMEVGLIRFA